MMLSHDERRELNAIEQRFESDEPELAAALSTCSEPPGPSLTKMARLALDLLAGLVLLLGAITLHWGLVFVGALLLGCAACAHLGGWTDPSPPVQYRRVE
ncbi:DUF3040 domain-containing protein [Prauserella cavernicola]|uniref:DUF3040 domain-containing protein n=1 Tax=Prauserella cavernicola TaxID=2800127 RepID=A0A934QXA5_9PSEU|nr:DUF3040 domain-containing protein [Prauserella cavernicola]MBK1786989.1 DUF3040 domain-containing protein [Prauserella cavernicola]